jgi:microcystin-dependent protein
LGGVSPFTATINLPDLRGRFALGASSGTMPVGRLSKALGSSAGAFTHNHTTSIAHNHADNFVLNAHNHSDNIGINAHSHGDNIGTGGANAQTTVSGQDYAWFVTGATYRYHSHVANGSVSTNDPVNRGGNIKGSVSTNNTTNQGGNFTGNVTAQAATTTATANQAEILPPYIALHYIIYTGVV